MQNNEKCHYFNGCHVVLRDWPLNETLPVSRQTKTRSLPEAQMPCRPEHHWPQKDHQQVHVDMLYNDRITV